MGKILVLPPEADLIEYVADLVYHTQEAGTGTLDFSDSLVVFPGRRPAHFLRKALAARAGRAFISPRIFSMDDFIDHLYEEILGIKDRKLGSIDALTILHDIHRRSPGPLGGERYLKMEEFIGIGTRLFRDLEECLMEDLGINTLETICISTTLSHDTESRLQGLASFYRLFYEELKRRGFSTRSVRYKAVCEADIDLDGYSCIIFAGFLMLTKTEKRLFRRFLSHPGTSIVSHDTDIVRSELEEISQVETVDAKKRPEECDIRIYKSPDSHGQVFVLAEKIKALKESGQINEKTLVVLPGVELLMPLLHHCLSLLDEKQYNISMGYPLYRTPIFAFYDALMDVVSSMVEDRLYVPSYIKFVLHPYTKNIYFRADGEDRPELTRILFHRIEDLLNERARVFTGLEEIEGLVDEIYRGDTDLELLSADRDVMKAHLREIHDNTIRRFSGFNDVADLSRRSAEILMYIYHNSTAPGHAFFYPFSEGFLRVFDELENSLFSSVSFDSVTDYFNFFRRYIKTCTLPFEGTPLRGLQVLGFLETRNIQFERVFFLNLNEGIVPEGRKEDSLIPQKVREILGLSTYRRRDALAGAYFDLLIRGAREAHLFYVENDRSERSRFIERIIWEKEKRAGMTCQERFVRPISYRVRLINPVPAPVQKTGAVTDLLKGFQFSASQLDDYLRCPLRFYYRYILGLEKRDEIRADPERRDIGILVHQILGEFFKPLEGIVLEREHLDTTRMEGIVERVFRAHYGEEVSGAYYLIKRQVKRRMADLLNQYYNALVADGAVIETVATEKDMQREFHGFRIKGIIDRIERRCLPGSGEFTALVDYKIASTGGHLQINFNRLDIEDRGTWSDAIGSIQIPLYMLLCEGRYRSPLKGFYLLLGKGRLGRDAEYEVVRTEEELDTLKEIILRTLREIVDPGTDFVPAADMRKNCPDCLYQDICGTQWIRGYTY